MRRHIRTIGIGYANGFLGFFTTLCLAKLLGAQGYSWVALGLAIGAFLFPLLDFGTERSFAKAAVALGNESALGRLAASNMRTRLTVALCALLPVVFICAFLSDSTYAAVASLAFAAWSGILGLYPGAWFDYVSATRMQNHYALVERCVALLAVGVFAFTADPRPVLVIGLILVLIRAVFVHLQSAAWRQRFIPSSGPGVDEERSPSSGTDWRIAAALVMNALLLYGNQLIIKNSRSNIELSSYSLVLQVMSMVFLFQSQLLRISSRPIAESTREGAALMPTLRRSAVMLVAGSALLGAGAWVFIEVLKKFVLGPDFSQMSDVSPVFAVWVCLLGFGLVITQYNILFGQETFYLATACIGGVVALTLGYLLIPEHGIRAAAEILLIVHAAVILIGTLRLHVVIRRLGQRHA